jgi:hypothetical protein
MYYTESELRRKLIICGGIMPDGEYELIEEALTSLVGTPRELRVFIEGFNCEVVAHVITCARAQAVKREALDGYWRDNDRREGDRCE